MPPTPKATLLTKTCEEEDSRNIGKGKDSDVNIMAQANAETAVHESERAWGNTDDEQSEDRTTNSDIKDCNLRLTQIMVKHTAEKEEKIKLARLSLGLKAKLLGTQLQSRIMDCRFAELYTRLCQNVSSWLSSEVSYCQELWTTSCGDNNSGHLASRDGFIPGHTRFLMAGHRHGRRYLSESYVIHQLHDMLFDDKKQFFAFDEKERTFIESSHERLLELDPPKDSREIRSLRSELLEGFMNADPCQLRRTRWMAMSGMGLLKRTGSMLPEINRIHQKRRANAFKYHVLMPAFELAVALHTSATIYAFSEPMTQETRFKHSLIKNGSPDYATMININTGRTIKVNQPATSGPNGVIAYRVLLVCPGLVRLNGHAAEQLTDDVICVQFQHSSPAQGPPAIIEDPEQLLTDPDRGFIRPPRKKRKIGRNGQACSSAVDVESQT